MNHRGKHPWVPAQKAPTPASTKPRAAPPTRATQTELRELERAAGNRAVNQMQAQPSIQAKPTVGADFRGVNVQAKARENRAARNDVVMRASMAIKGSLPEVNEPEDGVNVFSSSEVGPLDCTAKDVALYGEGNADMELYTNGQAWINTDVSKSYKENKDNIKSGEVKVDVYNKKARQPKGEETKCGVIQDGNHRVIWSFYHNESVPITPNSQFSGLLKSDREKGRFGKMEYRSKSK